MSRAVVDVIVREADDEASLDGLLGGRVMLRQPRAGFRVAMDSLLLASAVPAETGQSLLDIGAGTGAVGLCVAARVPGLRLTALERHEPHVALLRRNLAHLDAETVEADLAQGALKGRSFDHVVTNPPFHEPGAHRLPADASSAAADHESLPLAAWLDLALKRVASGGTLTLIHRADRLDAILAALHGRLGDLLVLPILTRAGDGLARRVILRGRKGSGAPCRLHRGLVLNAADGQPTAAARAILEDAASLDSILELA